MLGRRDVTHLDIPDPPKTSNGSAHSGSERTNRSGLPACFDGKERRAAKEGSLSETRDATEKDPPSAAPPPLPSLGPRTPGEARPWSPSKRSLRSPARCSQELPEHGRARDCTPTNGACRERHDDANPEACPSGGAKGRTALRADARCKDPGDGAEASQGRATPGGRHEARHSLQLEVAVWKVEETHRALDSMERLRSRSASKTLALP